MIYKVETIKDGTEKYFFIRNLETMSIEELPSKYLMHGKPTRLIILIHI